MLLAQPPTKPLSHVRIDCPVRLADRTQAEVVTPTGKDPIECHHFQRSVDQESAPVGQFAYGAAYLGDAFLRRARANVAAPRLLRIALAKGASRPVEFHHQPLSELSVTLSRHSAPIRRTYRSCQVANARRDVRFAGTIFAEIGSRGSCGL